MRKNIQIIITVLAVILCITCFCSCENLFDLNPDGITELYFVSCTTPNNSLYMSKGFSMQFQKESIELAHEVESIPDPVSAEGVCSYMIRITYVENDVTKQVEKTGYDSFPDNWDKVVELTNTVAGAQRINNSTELAVVDANYMKKYCHYLNLGVIPDDMTLDDVIKGANITYLTLYEPTVYVDPQQLIEDYLFDYLDLRSCLIEKLDENPDRSTTAELRAFADSRPGEVVGDTVTEYSCIVSYKDSYFEIVRYDMVQTWLDNQKTVYTGSDHVQNIEKCRFIYKPYCQLEIVLPAWEFGASGGSEYKKVFVDRSGKYLIVTDCCDLGDIADMCSLFVYN